MTSKPIIIIIIINELNAAVTKYVTVPDKLGYLEGQSKRNNLTIDRIAHSPTETWIETEEKVKVLAEKLHLQQEIEMERACRTGIPGGDKGLLW